LAFEIVNDVRIEAKGQLLLKPPGIGILAAALRQEDATSSNWPKSGLFFAPMLGLPLVSCVVKRCFILQQACSLL